MNPERALVTRELEELNKTVAVLLSRAQSLAPSSHGHYGGSRDTDSITSLRKDCQAIKAEIQQLKQQCNQLPEPPTQSHELDSCVNAAALLVDELRLKAELAVLQREKADVLSTNDAVRQSATHQQLSESCVQLNELLTCLKHKKKRVREEHESEQTLLKETLELETALERELSSSQSRRRQREDGGAETEMKRRISMAEENIRSLRDSLVQFTSDEIIQPSEETEEERRGRGRKRGCEQARVDTMLQRRDREGGREHGGEQFPTLANVVQDLILKTLTSPHSPYLPLSSIWTPHSNLLLRSGVIQRHPDNPSLVRVTPFHL